MDPDDSTKKAMGTIAALLGGALIMLGSTLTWAKLVMNMPGSGSQEEALSGMSAGDGKITLALGAISIAVAAASLISKKKGEPRTVAAVVGVAAGGFASILGVMFAMDVRAHALDYAITQAGMTPVTYTAPARQILDEATAISNGWGLYLVILGGIVAAVGGVLAAIALRRTPASGDSEAL